METDYSLDNVLISRYLVKKIEDMLQNMLRKDEKSLRIALNILDVYTKEGSKGVKDFINRLLEDEIGDKA